MKNLMISANLLAALALAGLAALLSGFTPGAVAFEIASAAASASCASAPCHCLFAIF